jgi:hypothetical protein
MTGRYRQAKATKCVGKDEEESECFVVPMKLGDPARETQWRERGTVRENRWRER